VSTLSHVGLLALSQHVLLALPVYHMGAHSLSKRTLVRLVSEIRRFFWGKTQQGYYLAYVSWDWITLLKDMGGLGLRRLDTLNEAVLIKAFWVLLTKQHSI
jgi:hypothetical protein